MLAGLALRLWLLSALPPSTRTTGDTPYYFALAQNVLLGHGYSSDRRPPFSPSIERPPAYPAFVALVWLLTGQSEQHLAVAQIGLDLVTLAIVFAIALDRFGVQAASASALLYALTPFAAGMSLQFMSEGLSMFAVALAVLAVGLASQRGAASWAMLSGVAWGIGVLARPFLAPAAVVGMVALAIEAEPSSRSIRRHARWLVLPIAGSALVIGPWVFRNYVVATRTALPFVAFQTYGSRSPFTDLYTPDFLRWYRSYEEPFLWMDPFEVPRARYLTAAEEEEVRALWREIVARRAVLTPELNARFRRITDDRYRAAPLRLYVLRPLTLAVRYWLSPRLSTVRLSLVWTRWSRRAGLALTASLFALNLGLVAAAFWGVVLDWRSRRSLILWAPALALTVTLVTLAHRESRLTMPFYPILCVSAGAGVRNLYQRLRRKRPVMPAGGEKQVATTAVEP